MKALKLLLVPAFSLAACTTYVGPNLVAMLGATPALGGGSYSSGGGVTVAADVRAKDGMTLVCGVWAQSKEQSILTKNQARDVVAKGSIFLVSERIAQHLAFMREVAPTSDYSGKEANCRLTERPWQAGDADREISIRIPRHVVNRDIDDLGGGFEVNFIPDGPGAGGF